MRKTVEKILVVDDLCIIGIGMEKITERLPYKVNISSITGGSEVTRFIRDEDCDLVILDISVGNRNGLEILKDIKQSNPKLPVLIYTFYKSIEFVRRALKNGASGYISKNSSQDEVLEAIKTILAGGKYLSQDYKDELIFKPEMQALTSLSEREFQVLIGIGLGKTIKEIGSELFISAYTVETYRARLKVKLGISRDAELIRYCIREGLVNVELK
jgi:two-component system invasion response regulator UvrY